MKDFFVSYSNSDRLWAEWIAWQLEAVGYKTIIQAWDFIPGSNFVIEMDDAAQKANCTIAVLSPDYTASIHTKPEWAACFAEDPTGKKGSLIPILVRKTELKGLLKQRVYIDLLELYEEQARRVLLEGVSGHRTKPKNQPRFPGKTLEEQTLAQLSKPDFPGEALQSAKWVPEIRPQLGDDVYKKCNRFQQENEFFTFCRDNLEHRLGVPQVYFIYGEEAQCHDSLVERLFNEKIKLLVEDEWGSERGVPGFARLGWAYHGGIINLKQQLQEKLFSEFAPNYMGKDLSSEALSNLLGLSKKPLYVIQHNIHATRWDNLTRELLKWYLKYWSDIQKSKNKPQLIIFICVIFPDTKSKFKLSQWLLLNKDKKKRVEEQLKGLVALGQTTCACFLLEELSPIEPYEVKEWFSSHSIYPLQRMRGDVIEKIFRGKDGRIIRQKNMADIESELLNVVESVKEEQLRKKGHL